MSISIDSVINVETKISELKSQFLKIKESANDIIEMFENLDIKISKLKRIYQSFLKDNQNSLFIFGLDSFNFQNKLIDVEYSNMRSFYNLICNRIYCDYYKLHGIIVKYITEDIDVAKIKNVATGAKNKFPVYDYLNIYKHYDVELTSDIFDDIMSFVIMLHDHSNVLETEIHNYNDKKRHGLNINNFIYTASYKNAILNEQINLYINYLSFFLSLHSKYLSRFILNVTTMYSQINQDINFDKEVKRINSQKDLNMKGIDGNDCGNSNKSKTVKDVIGVNRDSNNGDDNSSNGSNGDMNAKTIYGDFTFNNLCKELSDLTENKTHRHETDHEDESVNAEDIYSDKDGNLTKSRSISVSRSLSQNFVNSSFDSSKIEREETNISIDMYGDVDNWIDMSGEVGTCDVEGELEKVILCEKSIKDISLNLMS
jgi:regulator of replication initiation timing